jgi:hypothetical protein
MRIPNQSLGVVRQSKVRYQSATAHMQEGNHAIVPQSRVGGGGLGDVYDCVICTFVCWIAGLGGVLECDQACRAAGCMGMLQATLH